MKQKQKFHIYTSHFKTLLKQSMFYIQLTSKAGKLELQEEKILREIGVFVLQLQDEIYLYFKNYIVPISVLRYSGFRNIP